MKRQTVTHEFVDYIPDKLKDGVVYVCIQFSTAVHRCMCGCGREVVTPISPVDWTLTFDGQTISLNPSIGNWSFPCRSHYWVKQNEITWAPKWSQTKIEAGRAHDRLLRESHFNNEKASVDSRIELINSESTKNAWLKLKKWLLRN